MVLSHTGYLWRLCHAIIATVALHYHTVSAMAAMTLFLCLTALTYLLYCLFISLHRDTVSLHRDTVSLLHRACQALAKQLYCLPVGPHLLSGLSTHCGHPC